MDAGPWRGKIYSGGWVAGAGGEAAVIEPATGQEIGRTGIAAPADVAHAARASAAAAAAAQPAWAVAQTAGDEPNMPFGGPGASGAGARFGGTANLDAVTHTRWVTVRGDIAPYPFSLGTAQPR